CLPACVQAHGRGSHLARSYRLRRQHSTLSGVQRYPPHGGPLGLRAAWLFAAPAACHAGGPCARLSFAPADGSVGLRLRAASGVCGLVADGVGLLADLALLSALAAVGSIASPH